MIKVEVLSNHLTIKKVSIKGHAMYDDYGKDIVCAACSSIVTTTINGILKLDNNAIEYKQDSDGIIIDVINANEVVNTLLYNMIDLLKELESNYPKNISVK